MIAERYAKISDFCETGSGTTPSRQKAERYYGGAIPWVKSGELREGEITKTEESVTDAALKETSLKIVPAGALLVAMYGATVGRVGRLGIEATTNQAICHIVPNPSLADERYMFHALCAKASELVAKGVGGAQPNISQGTIKETTIYLPALDEQKRIAAILDQADELRRKRQRAIDRLNQLGQAIFYEMFGDPSINPMNWPLATIGDLAESTQYGTSGKAADVGKFPILRMGNLSAAGEISLKSLKFIDFPDKDVEKYTVRTGDMLFNRTNSPDLVGKTAVYYGEKRIGFAGYLVRLRVNENAVPEYISSFLNTPFGKKVLRGMCKAIIGMANINAKELRSIIIPMPPIELQRQYQDKILKIRGAIDAPVKHKSALDSLFQSLQHRAFQGEL